jgi:hypothetical protein
VFNFERGAADCGKRGEAAGAFAALKKQAHRVLRLSGPLVIDAWAWITSFLWLRHLHLNQWTVEIDQEPIEFVRSGLFTRFELSGYPHPPTPLAARLVKKRPPPPETAS